MLRTLTGLLAVVVLCAGAGRVSADPVAVIAAPDLFVQNISMKGNTLYVRVFNNGTAAGKSTLRLSVSINRSRPRQLTKLVPSLGPGQGYTAAFSASFLQTNFPIPGSRSIFVTATADALKQVAEANEFNNSKSVKLK